MVFAREPVLGRVKTRLARAVGDEAALALHRAFLADVIALAHGVAERTVLAVAGDPNHRELAGLSLERVAQSDGDLGARMDRAIRDSLSYGPVCIIGSDSPTLPRQDVAGAFIELERQDIVIGPAGDGGYWLIGARQEIPELFADIPWSTAAVLPETLRRLQGRRYALLPQHHDVDEPSDLARLRSELLSLPDTVAPATRSALLSLKSDLY